MRRIPSLIVIATLAAASTVVSGQGNPPAAPALTAPADFGTQTGQRIRVTAVARGLVHPWSIAFPDATTMLVTEQPGRVRVIRDGVLLPEPAWAAPKPPNGNDALHFIAVHPQFATNG